MIVKKSTKRRVQNNALVSGIVTLVPVAILKAGAALCKNNSITYLSLSEARIQHSPHTWICACLNVTACV